MIKCPLCGADSRIIESRKAADGTVVRRRRECCRCGHRMSSYEHIGDMVHCTECKYYNPPLCTFYSPNPMTSRKGFCYHGARGKYKEDAHWTEKYSVRGEANEVR